MWDARSWSASTRRWVGFYTLIGVAVGLAALAATIADPQRGLAGAIRPETAWLVYFTMPIMILVMIVLYTPAALSNPRLTGATRGLWIAGFVLAGIVAIPLYWYLHVMNAPYAPPDPRSPEADPPFWLRPR